MPKMVRVTPAINVAANNAARRFVSNWSAESVAGREAAKIANNRANTGAVSSSI